MSSETKTQSAETVSENIRGTKDALTVRRVFGEPEEVNGVTIIPVARVAGGAGGGGGEGSHESDTGSGFGTGFGLQARPVGVYAISDGNVEWKPSIDVNRLARGGQVLAGLAIVCLTFVLSRRRR